MQDYTRQINQDIAKLEAVDHALTEDDVGQMFQLGTHLTGLPMLVLLADYGTSTGAGIYVFDSYSDDVEDHPELVHNVDTFSEASAQYKTLTSIDIRKLQHWLVQNAEVINKLKTQDIPAYDIYKEFELLDMSKNEMANLYPEDTKLPTVIYVSSRQATHGPRIKVLDGHTWVPVSISQDPKVLVSHKFRKLKTHDLQVIFQWILQHYDTLMALWNKTEKPDYCVDKLLGRA